MAAKIEKIKWMKKVAEVFIHLKNYEDNTIF